MQRIADGCTAIYKGYVIIIIIIDCIVVFPDFHPKLN